MKIHLDRVVDEPFDWQETLELADDELDLPEVVDLGEIQCRGRIRPTHPDYLLDASLTYVQTLRCVRCLEGFETPVASEVSLLIRVGEPETSAEELELEEEDLGILSIEEPQLDTHPILLEQVHLGVPMKPLCREDCTGLCADCGQNLNAGPCGCLASADPRWNALAGLKLQ